MRLICAAVFLLAATDGQAFFGRSNKAPGEIEASAKRASDLSREAELVWKNDQDGVRAEALYQQAVDVCLEVEAKYPKADLSAVRFRRAFCETQVDQLKFDAATGPRRRVAVMGALPAVPAEKKAVVAGHPDEATGTPSETPLEAPADVQSVTNRPVSVADELAWARDMLDAGDSGEARTALMNVLRADSGNRPARLMLAVLECKRRAYQDALLILEDLQAEREEEAVQLLIAGAYLGAGQPYRAMLELDKLLTNNPTHPDALMNMAYLTMEMSAKPAEAERYYRLAVKFGVARDPAFEKRLGF
jgi:tetratricopeptide (TPR) repeat protein